MPRGGAVGLSLGSGWGRGERAGYGQWRYIRTVQYSTVWGLSTGVQEALGGWVWTSTKKTRFSASLVTLCGWVTHDATSCES